MTEAGSSVMSICLFISIQLFEYANCRSCERTLLHPLTFPLYCEMLSHLFHFVLDWCVCVCLLKKIGVCCDGSGGAAGTHRVSSRAQCSFNLGMFALYRLFFSTARCLR